MNLKHILGLALVLGGTGAGYAGVDLKAGTLDELFQQAAASSGSHYMECERRLLAADKSVVATLQTNLRNSDPMARLLAQVLLDGRKGGTNDYRAAAEYLEWLVKRSPVTEGGPPSPPMLAKSLASAFDGRVVDFLALRLVKEDKEDLPGWLRRGIILYLQQQKSRATTAALLRFGVETKDEGLRDCAVDAIRSMPDPELPKKLEAEREYAKKQGLAWPSALEALEDKRP